MTTTHAPAQTRGYNGAFQKAVFQGNREAMTRIAGSDPEVLAQRIPFNQHTMVMFAIGNGLRPSDTVESLISLAEMLRSGSSSALVNVRIASGMITTTALSVSIERLGKDPSWKPEHEKVHKLLRRAGFSE